MQLLQESPIEKEALHRAVNYPKNNNKKEGIFSGKEMIGTLRSETNTQKKVMTLLKIFICQSFHYKHTTQELTANP